MSEPLEGGGTVFTELKTAVLPSKVFFFFLTKTIQFFFI